MNLKELVSLSKEVANFLGTDDCEDHTQYMTEDRAKKIIDLKKGDDPLWEVALWTQALVIWSKYGHNTFDLSDNLLSGLLLTTPTDAPGFPRLPFPSFMIRLSPGFIPYPTLASKNPVNMEWLTIIRVSHLQNVLTTSGNKLNLLHIHSSNDLDPAKSIAISQSINEDTFVSAHDLLESHETFMWEDSEVQDPECEIATKAAVRVVFNLCSWLESVGGLSKQKQADRVLASMAKQKGKPYAHRWILGSEIEVSSELVEAAKQSGRGQSGGWHVMRRHVVRGHMRNQACGTKHQDHKPIWIAPFWKGPVGGDVLDHIYKVSESLKKE